MIFTASSFPFRIKKLSIHNPGNLVDYFGQQLATPDKENSAMLDQIGPEIISINLKNWGSSKQKIIIHDLRLPVAPLTAHVR